ncbi:MAG TPA: bifunctional phosphopantothenoylcysteine decarboxylase/phosphopantothenate--cysteine ligase CoaBC [Opitutae bacterium]|nr:bifunctional phosphopantothenoylcysteine decarboxylase/phosphopantothenate--cysteine ligase CoaBC [Opitutaceae bacterium]HCR30937.1 bifunctional phosphopantothenoylcysteine decarboxylase/phosphopantothenate--cysteine ligase CoaBC [Opitutae bacterium]|tara:strand:- start:444 stop:1640 length:1197 start_codon:yes stop_codon:yes gene_type:complete
MLAGKRILLIITGSIAAYKSLELIRLLTKAGAVVEAVLTKGGKEFVTQLSVETLTGRKAHLEMWGDDAFQMNHIELSRNTDLIVAAPATADFIAKMVGGEGDDLATTVMLAKNKPVILAPSMNVEMWENPAFQRNLEMAGADGATIVPPQVDELACGEVGIGKMAEPQAIFESVIEHFEIAHTLDGERAIVTTGGTIERIDTVRYISNFSSGKQGNAIALALAKAGAQVSLVAGANCSSPDSHPNLEVKAVESAEEMSLAVKGMLPADIFVACAAVCDFKVANQSERKITKSEGLSLEFAENPDIVASVGNLPSDERPRVVVSFAAETENLIDNAKSKRASKGCDLVVANDVGGGAVFGEDTNQASFVSASGVEALDLMSKAQLGRRISDWIARFLKD